MSDTIRPRLPKWFKEYLPFLKSVNQDDFERMINPHETIEISQDTDDGGKIKWEQKDKNAIGTYEGKTQLTTKEEAIQFFEIDTQIWRVTKWVANNWAGNTQVKLWLSRRDPETLELYAEINKYLDQVKKVSPRKRKASGRGDLVVACSDFHLGADIKKMARLPDFNINVLASYFDQIVKRVNDEKFDRVHLVICGDLIESFTGLNHLNIWKELQDYGASAIIKSFELISGRLLEPIKNLQSVYLVSGNHDRVTIKKELDNKGETAALLAYMIDAKMKKIKVKYDPMIVDFNIGGVSFVVTHGHHGLSKKDVGKTLYEYGDRDKFNVLLEGHLHSRIVKRAHKAKKVILEDTNFVEFDALDYRKIVVPSLFTGNFYSKSLGYSSAAGFIMIRETGPGKIEVSDVMI